MTTFSSSVLSSLSHLMIPSDAQPTTKRKADDSNPLLAAAKRAKTKANAPNKRKLLNAEEQPGGLLIVRAPTSTSRSPSSQGYHPIPASQPNPTLNIYNKHPIRASSTQPQHSAYPQSTAGAGPSKQPSKKFRAESQPPPSTSRPQQSSKSAARDRNLTSTIREDPEIENDIRAMEDETDHLRRNSRAHTTIDPSLSANQAFHFPPRPDTLPQSKKGKLKVIDTSLLLPTSESPQIARNKLMREGAMNAIASDRGREPERNVPSGLPQGHRRKSSINRGKRISSAFETTGVITQPHNSVSNSSFYKHIDCDLPDVERIRQLLIWCSSRAASTAQTQSTDPPPPPLSEKAASVLKLAQDDLVRMLAEKKVDLSLYPPEASGSGSATKDEPLRENEQNVTNRGWEVTYSKHIQKAQEEDEAWKKVSYVYDAYTKSSKTALEKRVVELQMEPSQKAKGKQREIEADIEWKPREHELPGSLQQGVALARAVLNSRPTTGDDRVVGGSRRRGGGVGIGASKSSMEMEEELKSRLQDLQFKVDQLHTLTNAARATTNIAETMLDQRFELLSLGLTLRTNPPPPPPLDPTAGSGAQMLSKYVERGTVSAMPDPRDLLRALTRVDRERPPAMIGDAARRAAREVQRAGESGVGAVGERRLTGLPNGGMSQTPRKTPGTPRRGGTPARDKDR